MVAKLVNVDGNLNSKNKISLLWFNHVQDYEDEEILQQDVSPFLRMNPFNYSKTGQFKVMIKIYLNPCFNNWRKKCSKKKERYLQEIRNYDQVECDNIPNEKTWILFHSRSYRIELIIRQQHQLLLW